MFYAQHLGMAQIIQKNQSTIYVSNVGIANHFNKLLCIL
jgi:hypothetical protein